MFCLLKCNQVKDTGLVTGKHLIADIWWKHLIEAKFKLTKKTKKRLTFENACQSS